MNCLLCRLRKTRYVFTFAGKDIYKDKLNIKSDIAWYECDNCGVFFSKHYKHINRIYEDDTLYDGQYDRESIRQRYNKIMSLDDSVSDNAGRVRRVKDYHGRFAGGGIVLDVGAGLGVFLGKFLDTRYQGEALETNSVAAEHLKQQLNIPVYQCLVQNFTGSDNRYDLITANRVIEHIERPIEVLMKIKHLLKKNGIFYIELPDTMGYEFVGNTEEGFASGHYMVYNCKSLLYLLNKAGLDVLALDRVKEPSGKFTVFAFARRG